MSVAPLEHRIYKEGKAEAQDMVTDTRADITRA